MKKLVIIILTLLLVGGAFLSRPSRTSFENHVHKTMPADQSDALLEQASYRDRYIWADVVKDGKVIYTGVFSQWFAWGTREQTLVRE